MIFFIEECVLHMCGKPDNEPIKSCFVRITHNIPATLNSYKTVLFKSKQLLPILLKLVASLLNFVLLQF